MKDKVGYWRRRPDWLNRSIGLRPRMIISFGIPFVAIVVAMKWAELFGIPLTGFEGETSDLRAQAFASLDLVADLKKERLERWLEERRDDATPLVESKDLQQDFQEILLEAQQAEASGAPAAAGSGGTRQQNEAEHAASLHLAQRFALMKTTYHVYEAIGIADARTGMIVASTDATSVGNSVSDEKYFTGLLKPGAGREFLTVSSPPSVAPDQLPRPELVLSRKVANPDDRDSDGSEPIGVLIVRASLDDIIGPILQTGGGLGRTGEALLVDQDVRILTSLAHPLADGSRAEPFRYQISAKPAELAAAGRSGIITSTDYRGEKVLAAYRHIPLPLELGWGLVVKQDEDEVFGVLQRSATYTAWIGVSGAALVLVIAFAVATGLTRPIRALENAVTRFGSGDRTVNIKESSDDEIGRLAREFNRMATSLNQREEEINRRSAQLEAANSELALANSELASFPYSVSHDLRSPLRTVDGFARILEEDYGSELSDEAKRYLGLVRGGAQQMGDLIGDLLAFSRLGQQPIEKQRIDPTPIVRQVLSDLSEDQSGRSVDISVGRLPGCTVDPAMLRQVYTNLIGNALKFTRTRDPAVIEVGSMMKDGTNVYFVRDNGVGFDMKYADKMFGVFQRLHRSEDYEGSGVGTAIVQRIIHRHGGTIWADAQVDKGATFCFTLSAGVTNVK